MSSVSQRNLRLLVRLRRVARNEQLYLSVLAMVVGSAAAAAAILFRLVIEVIQFGFFGFMGERVYTMAGDLPWWQVMLVPAVGGLLIGLFVHRFMPNRRPEGVANVMEAAALQGGRIPIRAGIGAALTSAASIGVGASVGREGPAVHLGATLASFFAERLHLSRSQRLTLLGCGVAAAVAASFNAPIAGVLFAIEVVIGHYALKFFAPVVVSAVMGTIVSRVYFGDFPAFIIPSHEIVSFWEFPAFAILGVLCAGVAIVFMHSIMFTQRFVERIPVPQWVRPAGGGLAVGVIAIAFPQVLGVGYEATDAALKELFPFWLLVALVVVKTAATAISLGCGFGGGVFSPSLMIGALVGGAFGIVATWGFPHLSSGHGAYTLVGMGAVAGAVLGAPMSTILIIFELTGDYELTIAVMFAVVIATAVTQQVHGHSFFTWQLAQRGLSLKGGRENTLLRSIHVRDVMDRVYEVIRPGVPLTDVRSKLQTAPWGELFLVDADGRLAATVTFADITHALEEEPPRPTATVEDVARLNPPVLEIEDDLETAMKLFGAVGEAHIAVVDDHDSMKIVGIVHERDVILAYNRTLMQARAEERGEA